MQAGNAFQRFIQRGGTDGLDVLGGDHRGQGRRTDHRHARAGGNRNEGLVAIDERQILVDL